MSWITMHLCHSTQVPNLMTVFLTLCWLKDSDYLIAAVSHYLHKS